MTVSTLTGLINNAALLVLLALLIDFFAPRYPGRATETRQLTLGLIIGLVGVGIMLTPWEFSPGVVFDTRSVLLAVSGLFFGTVPTLIAVSMTAGYRFYLGGPGVWVGILVILSSGLIGIAWRHLRQQDPIQLGRTELYLLGLLTHVVMLLYMLLLPRPVAFEVLARISLPVLLIFPVATLLLGTLVRNRLEQFRDRERFRFIIEGSRQGTWEWDLTTDKTTFNETWAELLGYTLAELTPYDLSTWERLIHPEDRDRVEKSLQDYLAGKTREYDCEHRLRHKDGHWVWILDRGKAVEFDRDGRPLRMFGTHADITRLKTAEEQSSQAALQLSEAVRAGRIGLWNWNLSTNEVAYSREWKEQIGHQEDEIGNSFEEWESRVHPEDLQPTLAQVNQAIQDRADHYRVEFRFRHRDGSYRWILAQASIFLDDTGAPSRVLGSHIDITDRKQSEYELKSREEQLRSYLENAPVGIVIVAPDGSFVDVNPAGCAMTGYSRAELIGTNLLELYADEHRDLAWNAFRRLQESGSAAVELPHINKDGSRRYWRINATLLGDGLALGFLLDITDRREAERQLREQNTFISTILDNLPIGLAVNRINEETATYMNEAFTRIYGWPKEELRDIPSFFEKVLPDPLKRTELEKRIRRDITSGDSSRMHWENLEITRSDGTTAIISARNIPLFEQNLMISTVQDITEQRQAEQERELLQQQLIQAQKMEAVGRLAGGVAHDFNNMLGVILGYTDLALEQIPPEDELHASISEVYQAAQRSSDLTSQLLAFARKQSIAPKVLELDQTIGSMLNMLRRLIGEAIELEWRPSAERIRVKLDPTQIDTMLANLCVNARDAIEGNGRLVIETSRRRFSDYLSPDQTIISGSYARIVVRDNGHGMDRETLERIFEPFFTTKKQGEGTGLGLSTVFGVVKQNRGWVEVSSEPGRGTSFTIYLPEYLEEEGPVLAAPSIETREAHEGAILLVEDEPMILKMTTQMLQRLSYQVLPAAGPEQAIKLAGQHGDAIDLLMTDVIMPRMNGKELADQLTAINPRMKLLFVSGYTDDIINHYGVLDEDVHFLQKPFSRQKLGETIYRILNP